MPEFSCNALMILVFSSLRFRSAAVAIWEDGIEIRSAKTQHTQIPKAGCQEPMVTARGPAQSRAEVDLHDVTDRKRRVKYLLLKLILLIIIYAFTGFDAPASRN
jgi:hypothetical protein